MYSGMEIVKEVVGLRATVVLLYDPELKRWKVASKRGGINYSTTTYSDEFEAHQAFKKRIILANKELALTSITPSAK